MQLSDLTSKTPEELNVMCAKLCGWIHREATSSHPVERNGMKLPNYFGDDCVAWWHEEREGVFSRPPNYTGSWDAIMPEVSVLSETDYEVFANWLFGIVWSDGMSEREHDRAFDTACPLNRTTALILTLTK